MNNDDKVQILINKSNISGFQIETLYRKEEGIRNFLLKIEQEELGTSISKLAEKITPNLIKLITEHDMKFEIENMPLCIFEKNLLKPELRKKFSKKIIYNKKTNNENHKNTRECFFCSKNNICSGISQNYIKKHTSKEFKHLPSKEELYELNLKEANNRIKNSKIQKKINIALKNLREKNEHEEKTIIYARRLKQGKNLKDEEFSFHLYNLNENSKKNQELLEEILDIKSISKITNIINLSSEFKVNLKLGENEKITERFELDLQALNPEQKKELSEKLNIELNLNDTEKLGIELKENEEKIFKIKAIKEIKKEEIKKLIQTIPLENKRKILMLLNSFTKPIEEIRIDEYEEEPEKKRIEIIVKKSIPKIYTLTNTLGEDMSCMMDKEINSLIFELENNCEEKITSTFYLKSIIEEEQEE